MHSQPYFVSQDGADFYVATDREGEHIIRRITAPFKVGDGDMIAASKAREWFNEWGYFKGAETMKFVD